MKRILFVVEAMGGGVFTYIVDLANELVKNYDIYIAYAIRPQTPKDYKSHFDSRIHLIEVKNFTRSINPIKDFKAIKEVKRIEKEILPDIIHLHSSKAGVIGRIAFAQKDTPLFYTPHGYSFLMENYNPIKRMIFRFIEKIMAKNRCTTISCSIGEHYETLKITKNAHYISNGINIGKLEAFFSTVPVIDHPFTVFTLGRICPQKNPRLFNEVAEALPDVNFLWVGDGELRDVLKSKNIHVTGWVDRKEALRLCFNSDVFILTSLWEGLPISLLEAMYMKKLCVVSDVIGNHDVIENGRNGFVCRTVPEFTEAIKATNTERMVLSASQDIKRYYNTVVMAEEYMKIYEGGTE